MDYKRLLDKSPYGVTHVNWDKKILYVNPVFCEFVGYSYEELVSMTFTDITHPDDLEMDLNLFYQLQRGEITKYRIKKRYVHKSGRAVWADLYASIDIDDLKSPKFAILGMVMDITELREKGVKIKKNNETFRAMFMDNPQPMGIYSLKTLSLLKVNLAFARLFGYSKTEMAGLRVPDIITDDEEQFKNYLKGHPDALIDGSIWTIITKGGEQRIVEGHSHFINYKGEEARHVMFIDITERKQQEMALLKNRDSIRQAQVIAKMGSYEYNPYTERAVWSKNLFDLLKVDPSVQDISLDYFKRLVHQDDRHLLDEVYNSKRWTAEGRVLEYRIVMPDGRWLWVEDHMEPVLNDDELVQLRGVILDVTERKEKNEELLKLSDALEQSPVLIMMINQQGVINYVNACFEQITGFERAEVLGTNYRDVLIQQMGHSLFEEMWTLVQSGRIWKGELISHKKSMEMYWEERSISPLFNEKGNIVNYLIIGKDITDKKKTENELIAAKEKAEESARLKSSFLAIVSHELRTPLNPIIGFSNLLMDAPEEQMVQELAGLIHKSGEEMLSLIEDLFDLSFAKGHNLSRNNKLVFVIDLYTLARSSLEGRLMMSGKRDRVKLNFTYDSFSPDEAIIIDSSKVLQVLSILFNNALKFTDEGQIDFSMALAREAKQVCFLVRDTGIGIEPEKARLIFEEFRQVNDSATRNYGGLGIGLAIAKYLVSILGGTLTFNSEVGEGSAFYLKLPIDFSEKRRRICTRNLSPEEEFSGFNGKKILVIDGNPFVHEGIKRFLRDFEVTLISVYNGQEALSRISEVKPDFILIDILLPESGGIDSIYHIRSLYPKVPIFALLAYFMPRDRARALEAGCDGVMNKPVRRDILFNILKNHLK